MSSRSLIIATIVSLCAFSAFGQVKKMKFGKVDMGNLKMTLYAADSTAAAVVLADKGFSTLKYGKENGFYLQHTRHKRVKILTKEGYDQADVSVLLYQRGGDREKISGLKAATYNLENGKMKVSKLSRKSVFEEKYNKNYTFEKFTFPDVKEGSIIEYSYTLRSDFIFNLQDWSFQDEIPTVWSEYIVEIPEYFTYERFAQGFHAMSINDSEVKRDKIVFKNKSRSSGHATQTSFSEDQLDFNKTVFHWLAEKVPAFKEEPYMASTENFISKINFELASTQFPGSQVERYMGNWNDLNTTFLKSEGFGKALDGSGFLNETVGEVIANATTDTEKIYAIANHVKSTVSWNGNYGKYVSSSIRAAVKNGEGSSADLNLLVVNMLRKAGFRADAVLVSTRSNGFVREQFALSSQFNYVVAAVDIEGGTLLLDATDKTLPTNLLPQRCLNGNGWRVSASKPGWINVTSGGSENVLFTANMELTEEGSFKGNSVMTYGDYAARRIRARYLKEGDEFQGKTAGRRGWEINDLEVEGIDDLSKRVSVKVEMETGNGIEMLGDIVYLNPFVSEQIEENPFKLETRDFPVDFINPIRSNYMLTLEVPEDFVVEELPKSEVMTLAGGAGKFAYYMQQTGNTISFRCSVTITKSLFSGPEYPYLKQFWSKMVEKQAEQIVLKRKTE